MTDVCGHPDDDTPTTRDQWMECGGGPAALIGAFEAVAAEWGGGWARLAGDLGDRVGDLLDELAARGYRVTPIQAGPPFEALLPAAAD